MKAFFTSEMGARLRAARERAGLSCDEVAARLGLKCCKRGSAIARLERGGNPNPLLSTVINYLRICGASRSQYFELFDRLKPVAVVWPVVQSANCKVQSAKCPERATTAKSPGHEEDGRGAAAQGEQVMEIVRAGLSEEDKAKVVAKVQETARHYQFRQAFPKARKPLPPEQQRQATEKLARYHLLAATIGREITLLLADTSEPVAANSWYQRFARHVLSVVRKKGLPEDMNHSVLAASFTVREREMIQKWGLKEPIAGDVRALTIILYAKLKPQFDS